ncbi:hypothetical protein QOZ80_6BG0477860 [Eleusine coracana subsp. coracana]|nr:hypothetical protein QOZ80_6BG0477860 [Eleusine coracana subsp. coracana]
MTNPRKPYFGPRNISLKLKIAHGTHCLAQLHVYSSKPIDECAWSGILKIDNKEYISLAGHLSTKSGEKIWNMSKLLRRVVEATKVGRSEVWPKRWEASRPTSDNIGLYFFPYKMRHDKYHDHIVKEVMENDLALRVVIDEAEMLIFPSNLLPEQYQTFQSKHYLWGVFRPRVAEGKHGDESQHVDNTAEPATNATTSVPNDATVAALPTEANQGRTDSSIGAFPGKVVSFVVRQTPSVEQLIKQMEREGALIVAMRGGDASRRWVLA